MYECSDCPYLIYYLKKYAENVIQSDFAHISAAIEIYLILDHKLTIQEKYKKGKPDTIHHKQTSDIIMCNHGNKNSKRRANHNLAMLL